MAPCGNSHKTQNVLNFEKFSAQFRFLHQFSIVLIFANKKLHFKQWPLFAAFLDTLVRGEASPNLVSKALVKKANVPKTSPLIENPQLLSNLHETR